MQQKIGSRARYVIGPDGSALSLADLPPPGNSGRWVVRRKAVVVAAVRGGLLSIEDACEHYALTLHRWLSGLEANREEAIRLTDEVRYRIYRIYFAGAIEGFRTHTYNLNQVLVIKNSNKPTPLPLTRQDWYRPWSPSGK